MPLGDTATHGATGAFPDLVLDTTVLVVEESLAASCQPWSWSADHTACINETLDLAYQRGAKRVGLTRGRQYNYSDRIYLRPGTVLGAVGEATLPRPVLASTQPVLHGIALSRGGEIRNLDIRGPHYGKRRFAVQKHQSFQYIGVNGGGLSDWSVLGTSVDGFAGTGLLGGASHNVRIEGSTFSHNGYSGVSLFQNGNDCGSGVRFVGNLLEHNGQDGIDACSSNALYANNVIRHNGWDGNGGDRNGILVFAWTEGPQDGIQIVDNKIYRNGESGIRIDGRRVTDVVIRGNLVVGNDHWGLDLGSAEGVLENVSVVGNSCGDNGFGCWNEEHLEGVTITKSVCCD